MPTIRSVGPSGAKRPSAIGAARRASLFPHLPRYVPLKEDLEGYVPTSVIDPWGVGALRRRDEGLRVLIGDSGQSRDGALSRRPTRYMTNRVSVFSPVVSEILFRVYAPPAPAKVLDPFAGGGTRAFVAASLGYEYVGLELREAESDRVNRVLTSAGLAERSRVFTSDATYGGTLGAVCLRKPFDFILTCPPYGSLERYGGGPRDLSEMSHEEYLEAMNTVLAWSREAVAPGALSVWCVGNYLDGSVYRDIRGDLAERAVGTGWVLHDAIVLKMKPGTEAIRLANTLKGRRLVRVHEHALVLRAA